MSQSSSQALDPSWVSVPFAKFSHNSSPFGTRNFTWNHVGSRNDLDFILRNTRLVDENGKFHNRLFMKINAGAEELEQHDLCELVQQVQSFDPLSGGENPVQIVVKSPFLAMRYPKSANIVRRIQLKFHNDADFTKVLNFMKDLGLPITGSVPASTLALPSNSRPSASPSPSVHSDNSVSTSFTAPSMLSASSVSSTGSRLSLPTSRSSMYPAIPESSHSLRIAPDAFNSEFKVPMRPSSSFSEPTKLINSLTHAPQISRPATTSNFFPLTGHQLSQSFKQPPTSVYIKQMERESQSRNPSFPSLPVMKSSQEEPRPTLPLYQSQSHSASETSQDPAIQLTQSPFFAPRTVSPELRASITRELSPSCQDHNHENLAMDFQKRNAALFEAAEQNRLSMPPKRELPFPKPRDIVPRSASVSTFSQVPPPTPIPRPRSASPAKRQAKQAKSQTKEQVPEPVVKPTKKRVAQRKSTVVKPPEVAESPPPPSEQANTIDAASSAASPQDEPSPLAAKSFAATSRPASAASGLQSKATATAPKKRAAPARPPSVLKRPKMMDQSTQTELSPTRPAMVQTGPNEIPAPFVVPRSVATASAPTDPPESYLDAIDAFVSKHKARPKPKEIWEEPGWADADEGERDRILNNFICENLENKDFIQLCEDTKNSWRRMMGMDL